MPGKNKCGADAANRTFLSVRPRKHCTMADKETNLPLLLHGCRQGNRNSQRKVYEHFYGYGVQCLVLPGFGASEPPDSDAGNPPRYNPADAGGADDRHDLPDARRAGKNSEILTGWLRRSFRTGERTANGPARGAALCCRRSGAKQSGQPLICRDGNKQSASR